MNMITIVLALALIIGFMVADAILDWVFIAVYALFAMAVLNNLIHLFKYCKKYGEINWEDIGRIFLYIGIAVVVAILQVTFVK